MRENRTYGSEGGEAQTPSLPLSALAPHAAASSKAATVAPERGDDKTKHCGEAGLLRYARNDG
jgi:hypothetical protein